MKKPELFLLLLCTPSLCLYAQESDMVFDEPEVQVVAEVNEISEDSSEVSSDAPGLESVADASEDSSAQTSATYYNFPLCCSSKLCKRN